MAGRWDFWLQTFKRDGKIKFQTKSKAGDPFLQAVSLEVLIYFSWKIVDFSKYWIGYHCVYLSPSLSFFPSTHTHTRLSPKIKSKLKMNACLRFCLFPKRCVGGGRIKGVPISRRQTRKWYCFSCWTTAKSLLPWLLPLPGREGGSERGGILDLLTLLLNLILLMPRKLASFFASVSGSSFFPCFVPPLKGGLKTPIPS